MRLKLLAGVMRSGIPGTSMDASSGGGGRVSCLATFCAPPSFPPSLLPPPPCAGLAAGDSGRFSGLGSEDAWAPRPARTRPTPSAARPATTAPPPSSRKPPRPTAVPPDEYAPLDLTTGDDGSSGDPAGGAVSETAGFPDRRP